MKIIITVLSILVFSIISPNCAFSQFAGASVTDLRFGTSTTGVANTGNDIIRDPIGGVNIMVTVWDGSAPGIGWNDFAGGNIGFTALSRNDAYDPDVTLVRNGNNIHAVVVYHSASLSSGSFMVEYFDWLGSGGFALNTTITTNPATLMSNKTFQTAINIDGNELGDFAIIWDIDSSNVIIPKISTGIMNGGTQPLYFNSASLIAGTTTNISRKHPDICIYDTVVFGAQGSLLIYASTYNTGTSVINIQVERWQDLDQASPFISNTNYHNFTPTHTMQHAPRIACPNSTASMYDLTVVYGSGTRIESWNYNPGVGSPVTRTYNAGGWNPPGAINAVPNNYPAITYDNGSGNNDIYIGWTYDNSSSTYGTGYHPGRILPIAAKCNNAAVPQGTSYLNVPNIITGNAQTVSMCGKKASDIGVSWFDNFSTTTRGVYYKAQAAPLTNFRIVGNYSKAEKTNKVLVYDIQGKILFEKSCDIKEATNLLQQMNINPGVYFIKSIGDLGEQTSKYYKF